MDTQKSVGIRKPVKVLVFCGKCMRAKKGDEWSKLTRLDGLGIRKVYPDLKTLPIKEVICPDCTSPKPVNTGDLHPVIRLFAPLVSGARKFFLTRALTV